MIYLNYAALSPTHPLAEEEVARTLNEFKHYLYSDAGIAWYRQTVQRCRETVAEFLQVSQPSGIAFTSNASLALYFTLTSLQWKPEDMILTTTHENPSIVRQLRALEQRGIRLFALHPTTPENFLTEVGRHLQTNSVKALVMSHVSHVDGRIFPLDDLSALAKAHDCLMIVDGAQAVGHIPVNVESIDCDVYFFTGHKWCEGPLGTGAMWVQDRFFERSNYCPLQFITDEGSKASSFEIGTHNIGLIAGLARACRHKHQEGIGTANLETYRHHATMLFRKHPAVEIVGWKGPQAPGILTVKGKGRIDAVSLTRTLSQELEIIVKLFSDYPTDMVPAIRLSWGPRLSETEFERGVQSIMGCLTS